MKSEGLRKVLSLLVAFSLIFQQAGFAQGLAQLDISRYLGAFSGPEQFRPLQLRYFSYNPLTDNFQLLLDKGTLKKAEDSQIKEQGQELLKYFLVGVALPDENFWVNLRPDSEDQIISRELARTDVGKVLLEADLQLKKDVAKFTSPETAEGREYWNKLYQKAGQIFNASEITIPTLTRPWIVPGEVIIRESANSAYVYKGVLKVMLEQDHLKNSADYNFKDPRLKELNEYSSELIRETIIPKLTKEVNSSKRYAALRQVFFSLILSRWFKHKFAGQKGLSPSTGTVPVKANTYLTRGTVPSYVNLIDSGNLNGLTSQNTWSKTTYFEEYKKSFAQGEYNLKEQVSGITGPVIRSYFSGGISILPNNFRIPTIADPASSTKIFKWTGALFVTAALLGNGNTVLLNGAAPNGTFPELTTQNPEVTSAKASPPSAASPIEDNSARIQELENEKAGLQGQIKGIEADIRLNTEKLGRLRMELSPRPKPTDEMLALQKQNDKSYEELRSKQARIREINNELTGLGAGKTSSLLGEEESVTAQAVEPGKRIYFFGAGQTEGRGDMKELLGGKGAGLAEMALLGIPVPPGFTITTKVALDYLRDDNFQFPEGLQEEINLYLARLEEISGKKLGDPNNPLLVSVRSGAIVSMPGMLDTVLNLGLTDLSVEGLASKTNNPRFAWNSYARFIEMFSNIVLGIKREEFAKLAESRKAERGYKSDTELTTEDYKDLVKQFKAIVRKHTGQDFPQDPKAQLRLANEAVFKSPNNKRAKDYRKEYKISDDAVSAVNVQVMVFGNMGDDSATGVVLTRKPDGKQVLFGEYLINAQGEDVVAGIRTPAAINEYSKSPENRDLATLETTMPELFRQLSEIGTILDRHNRDMQDMEFTIQQGKLYMLQTRNAKRSADVMLRVAVQMAQEGLITKKEAVFRIDLGRVENELMHPVLDPKAAKQATLLATGTAGSAGAGVGRVVFTSEDAEEWADEGEPVILLRKLTEPEDLGGMLATRKNGGGGILTSEGGATSHAALVARGAGIPAVVGVGALIVNSEAKNAFILNPATKNVEAEIKEGDWLSIDGSTGKVYLGKVARIPSEIEQVQNGTMRPEDSHIYQDFAILLSWADEIRTLGVWANADTPEDARKAVERGAEGIGLTRTEHMVSKWLLWFQALFLTKEGSPEREAILKKIEDILESDLEGILDALNGLPATVRFFDPPVNEFMAKQTDKSTITNIVRLLKELSPATPGWWLQFDMVLKSVGLSLVRKGDIEEVKQRIEQMNETDPMLGNRGVRLLLTNPSILRMQTRAMVRAYANLVRQGKNPKLKMMVPNVAKLREFQLAKKIIAEETKAVLDAAGIAEADRTRIEIGTMIEQPSAALSSGSFAKEAQFFSFGTNDLTQFTFGLSRNDAAKSFLTFYLENGIFDFDPTKRLDANEVLRLINLSVNEGRAINPKLEIGVCGEQGGDPDSIGLFHRAGLTYVSASPPRIPIARLAAAQAEIKYPRRATIAQGAASSPMVVRENFLRDMGVDERIVIAESDGVKVSVLRRTNPDGRDLFIQGVKDGKKFDFVFNFERRADDRLLYGEAGQGLMLGIRDWDSFLDTFATGVDESTGRIEIKVKQSHIDIFRQLEKNNPEFSLVRINLGGDVFKEIEFVDKFSSVSQNPKAAASSPVIVSRKELPSILPGKLEEAQKKSLSWGGTGEFIVIFKGDIQIGDLWGNNVNTATKEVLRRIDDLPNPAQFQYELTNGEDLPEGKKLAGNKIVIRLKASSPVASSSMNSPETTDGIDPSTSLRVNSLNDNGLGGIDFRVITTITQPMGNLSGLNFSLPQLSNLENMNLDDELTQIQKMLKAGIIPSGERLKEYVAACYQKGELKEHLEGIVASVVDTCKLQEENVEVTSNALKEVMLILDSIS